MRNITIITALLLWALAPAAPGAAGGPVAYTVDGERYEGYYVSPEDGAPLVLLIHDWDGLTDYEIRRAGMLFDLGYAVFAMDLFGAGVRPAETAEKRRLTGALYGDRRKMRRLMDGALAAARGMGAGTGNAVAAGYCFGGAAVLEWARSGADLKGFATFHGGLEIPPGQDYRETKGKVLVLHGTADAAVTMDQFAESARRMESAGVEHEMVTYGGARHAFTVFGGERYQEAADRKSWRRFREFLAATLGN